MIMTLTVFKEVHNTWPAKNGKAAGESYDLLCMDNAPQTSRKMLYYKPRMMNCSKCGVNQLARPIQVGVSKIRHGDNGGKATLIGQIIVEPKK